jgi:endonuclease YncB( thermonuclease family)
MYIYSAAVKKVVDGDTLDLTISLGFRMFTEQRVRLLGINAPEHNTPEGKKAIAFVKAWIDEHGPVFTVRTHLDEQEKYGRFLAVVLTDTSELGQALIDAGLAAPWDGKGPRPVPKPVQ